MKSLPFALPRAFRNRTAGGSKGFGLAYTVLAAVLCFVMPLATAYAQEFSGTVSCVETSQVDESFVSTATVYDVELIGNTISGRWGEGRDTAFQLVPFYPKPGEYPWPDSGTSPEEFYSDLSAIFWTMPVDAFCEPDWVCLDFEQIYSETGKWNFKVQKGLLKVHGTSFVAMDYPFAGDLDWTTLSAQCTWTLSGPIPE